MEIAENKLDEERWGSWAKYIQNLCTDKYVVNFWPKALEQDRPMSFITQIECLVVDQQLRGLEAFGWQCLYIEKIYWLPIMTISIFTYNCWATTDCYYVIKVIINGASTISALTFLPTTRLLGHILPKWFDWRFVLVKTIVTRSLNHPGNDRQQCVNNFWSCESDN